MQVAVDTASTIGDHIVIPAVADRRIVIQGGLLVAKAATALTFKSGGVSLSGPIPLDINAGFVLPMGFDYLSGEDGGDFVLTTSAAVGIAGWLKFSYVYSPQTAGIFSFFNRK